MVFRTAAHRETSFISLIFSFLVNVLILASSREAVDLFLNFLNKPASQAVVSAYILLKSGGIVLPYSPPQIDRNSRIQGLIGTFQDIEVIHL